MIDERFDWLSIIGDIENDEITDDVVVFSVGDNFRYIDDATCLPYYIMPVRRDTKVNWNSSLPNILRDIVKPWLDHENPAVKLRAIICGSEVLQAKDLQLITKYRQHDNVWIRAAACAGTLRIGGKREDCDEVIAAARDLVVIHAESALISDEAFPNSASACEAFDFTFQCLRWKQLQFSNYEMSLVMPFCNFLTHQKNGTLADFYWAFGWQPICYCGSAMDKEDIKLRGVQLDARRRDELMRVLLSN